MAPPTKRRKRNVVSSSEDEDEDNEVAVKAQPEFDALLSSSPPPPRVTQSRTMKPSKASGKQKPAAKPPLTRGKTATQLQNDASDSKPTRGGKTATKSATSSPEKPKRKGKIEDKVKSGNIFTFFTKQAQRQQAEGGAIRTAAKPIISSQISREANPEDDNDFISDDDALQDSKLRPPSSMVLQAARKRARGTDTIKLGDESTPSASQKFITRPKEVKREVINEDDLRPWAERFAPVNLEELAVHSRKVKDVRAWLEDVMDGKIRQRVLILKGAAGTAKTTTIQLLAKAMDSDVLEWRNPVGSVATSEGYQSMADQFEEFLGRGGKFGQLDLFSDNGRILPKPELKPLDRRKQIILVEEFPNTFMRSSTALESFRSTLIQYLASNTPPLNTLFGGNTQSTEPITPVVLIISETLLTTTSASADSFTAHRLLGPEILQHPGVGTIEFNPIAPTLLAKGLEVIVQKEARKSGRKKTPGPQVLRKLGEVGDIRSAIGSLEFMCLRGDVNGDWGAKIAFGKAKKASKDTALTTMEEESLELITRREASLGIFHAVGRVMYNKREEVIPVRNDDVEKLPNHLSLQARPRRSEVIVEQLIDETGTDTQTFVAALHENYPLSCEASSTSFDYSTLDHLNGCIDALSDSDLLCPSWDGSFGASGFGGSTGGRGTGGDIMRQDEIAFQIAVRGILFSLPYPVKRIASAPTGLRTGKPGDHFKMFYPTSLKLWRAKEENESIIDLWVTRLMKGDDHVNTLTAGAAAFARPKAGTVESWKNAQTQPSTQRRDKEVDITPLMAVGSSARKEMLLERLPYMVIIAKARKSSSSGLAIREMEKVTTFRGIGGPSEDDPDDGEEAAGEEWATDKPGDGKSPRKKGLALRTRVMKESGVMHLQQPEQKLVLSDDDIEDD